jgi:hypothetical protein
MQKSYVGSAVVVFFLYWLCYFPGLLFNIIWLNDALKVKKVAGKSPSGIGCLWIMFLIGIIPAVTVFYECGYSSNMREAKRRVAAAQGPNEQRAVDVVAPSPLPPKNIMGKKYVTTAEITVHDEPPSVASRRAALINNGAGVVVLDATDYSGELHLRCEVSRWRGDTFIAWVRQSDFLKTTPVEVVNDLESYLAERP